MMGRSHARDFDRQARSFDRRAGLPPAVQNAIAVEIVRIASLGPTDLVVEIGAGTGQIGRALCAMPIRYLGLDLSRPMVSEFASWGRHSGFATPLAIADATRRWPLRDGSATAIFGSRSLHLFPLPHVMKEAIRVAAPPHPFLIVGWIDRDSEGLRVTLRREMHARLIRRGYTPCEALRDGRELLDAFVRRGASALHPRVAATWCVRRSADEMLEAWRAVDGLAGADVAPPEKEALLKELAAWGRRNFGSLDIVETNEERYMLAGVQLAVGSLAQESS